MATTSKRSPRGRRRAAQAQPKSIWQRGKWWFIGGGAVAVVAILVVLSTSLSGPETSAPGIAAPDLVLASTSGQEFRLSDERGKPMLLYFSFPG